MRSRPASAALIALLLGALPASLSALQQNADNAKTAKPAKATGAAVPADMVSKTTGEPLDAAGVEFFEKKIRPVLAQKCYQCHSNGAKTTLGNLALDTKKGMMTGGQRGSTLVPGDPDHSKLIEAIRYGKADFQMPPGGKLSEAAIADLTEWVKMGAPWPKEATQVAATTTGAPKAPAKDWALIEKRKKQHWAWQPVRAVRPPVVKRAAWARNPIDQFTMAAMEARGLKPNPYADRRTLIRRATFDLIGLPPTPDEVDAFLADKSPDAWSKVVDRLLANPHYGERWGRFWLDIARYGEDQAHSFEPRLYPQGFRYRDWVAHAFNADMPYDQFVKDQIAADLIDKPESQENLAALGFFATGPVYYGDQKMFDQYDDRIDTLSRGFLGLTVACARCHDHKFDPITQKDYYALAGIFSSAAYIEKPISDANSKVDAGADRQKLLKAKTEEVDKFTVEQQTGLRNRFVGEISRYMLASWKLVNRRKAMANLSTEQFARTESAAIKESIEPVILDRWMKYLKSDGERPLLAAWRALLKQQDAKSDLSGSESAIAEARKVADAFQDAALTLKGRGEPGEPAKAGAPAKEKLDAMQQASYDQLFGNEGVLTIPNEHFDKLLVGDPKVHYARISAELQRLKMGAFVHALTEGPKPADIHVLLRGNAEAPGEIAPRRFITILSTNLPKECSAEVKQGSGRLELANAIADKNNPLTARVMVNRLWQRHFGVGLVRTASNFGLLGEPPTHPELLDYLASQFMEHGWSIKTIHRQIMLSATYQMSGARNTRNDEIDPDNRFLWRASRRRLEIEAWRDSMLAVSNKLDMTIGGPSVSLSSPDNSRRTFYAAISRHDLDSMLRLFDFPDPNATIDARTSTTVPLQQLFTLNSEFMVRQARAFAARLNENPKETDAERITRAYLLVNSRPPSAAELQMGLSFLAGPRPVTKSASSEPGSTATSTTTAILQTPAKTEKPKASSLSRWEQYAQALLSANEFLYVD